MFPLLHRIIYGAAQNQKHGKGYLQLVYLLRKLSLWKVIKHRSLFLTEWLLFDVVYVGPLDVYFFDVCIPSRCRLKNVALHNGQSSITCIEDPSIAQSFAFCHSLISVRVIHQSRGWSIYEVSGLYRYGLQARFQRFLEDNGFLIISHVIVLVILNPELLVIRVVGIKIDILDLVI